MACIESEGVWRRLSLRCLRQSTLHNDGDRFAMDFLGGLGLLAPFLASIEVETNHSCHVFHAPLSSSVVKPQPAFTFAFSRDPVELSVDFPAE